MNEMIKEKKEQHGRRKLSLQLITEGENGRGAWKMRKRRECKAGRGNERRDEKIKEECRRNRQRMGEEWGDVENVWQDEKMNEKAIKERQHRGGIF